MRNGRFAEAYESMRRLRGTELQACRDFYLAHCQLQMEAELARPASSTYDEDGKAPMRWYEGEIYQQEVKKIGFWQRIWRLFTIGRNRRACYSSFVVMGAQILCGVCKSLLICRPSRVQLHRMSIPWIKLIPSGQHHHFLLLSSFLQCRPQHNQSYMAQFW
jgi:hypothetical protein